MHSLAYLPMWKWLVGCPLVRENLAEAHPPACKIGISSLIFARSASAVTRSDDVTAQANHTKGQAESIGNFSDGN